LLVFVSAVLLPAGPDGVQHPIILCLALVAVGALLGSLLMAIIVTAINIFHVDIYWNTFIIGATLLVAVLIDVLSKRKRTIV